jgi:hypothetical protein
MFPYKIVISRPQLFKLHLQNTRRYKWLLFFTCCHLVVPWLDISMCMAFWSNWVAQSSLSNIGQILHNRSLPRTSTMLSKSKSSRWLAVQTTCLSATMKSLRWTTTRGLTSMLMSSLIGRRFHCCLA